MAKGTTRRHRSSSRRSRRTPYPLPCSNPSEQVGPKKCSKVFEKKDWEDATCSVCMEYPHNAVLLLCASHEKGCRPYMCGTSFRYSNCLDQYKKAYTKSTLPHQIPSTVGPTEKCGAAELACPLCRGQVKGWTVVEPARVYLNSKKRSCVHDNCSFGGTYKEMRKHVRAEHPCARPREVDPVVEQKWTRLERERERDDVISTITSSTPGAVVFGDYVIERSNNNYRFDSDDEASFGSGINSNLMNVLLFLQAVGSTGNNTGTNTSNQRGGFDYSNEDSNNISEDNNDSSTSLAGRLRRQGGGILLGRSGRRRRLREAGAGQR